MFNFGIKNSLKIQNGNCGREGKGDNLKAFMTQRLKKMFLLRNTTRENKNECKILLKNANTGKVEDVLRSVLAVVMSAIETGSIPQQPRKDFCADVSRMVDSINRIQSLSQCDCDLFLGELHNKPSSAVQTILMDLTTHLRKSKRFLHSSLILNKLDWILCPGPLPPI